jgi:hypothetical protein
MLASSATRLHPKFLWVWQTGSSRWNHIDSPIVTRILDEAQADGSDRT